MCVLAAGGPCVAFGCLLHLTLGWGPRQNLHTFEWAVCPVTLFISVPDMTGVIPLSVGKKGLGTPIKGGCYIFVRGIVREILCVMSFGKNRFGK